MNPARLSHMGAWGAPSLKPTRTMGTAPQPWRVTDLSLLRKVIGVSSCRFALCSVPGPPSCTRRFPPSCGPSSESLGLEWFERPSARVVAFLCQKPSPDHVFPNKLRACMRINNTSSQNRLCKCVRTAGAMMKRSSRYPRRFGKAIARLHLEHVVAAPALWGRGVNFLGI